MVVPTRSFKLRIRALLFAYERRRVLVKRYYELIWMIEQLKNACKSIDVALTDERDAIQKMVTQMDSDEMP